MPKVTWDTDLTADDVESAELSDFQPYAGPMPQSGVYRFLKRRAKKDESAAGNPKLVTIWVLDGSWKTEHKKFNGCPLFDHMAVMKSMNWRVKAYCAAIGVTPADFMQRMVVDGENIVQKIGKLKYGPDDAVAVYINIKRTTDDDGNPRIELVGYLTDVDEDADDADDTDDTDDDGADPF